MTTAPLIDVSSPTQLLVCAARVCWVSCLMLAFAVLFVPLSLGQLLLSLTFRLAD